MLAVKFDGALCRHWPNAAAVGNKNAAAGFSIDKVAAGKVTERGQHGYLIRSVKTRQPQALMSFALQLKHRMAMSGDDVIAGVQGWRMPKRKWSKQ